MIEKTMLKTREAAAFLGVSPTTLGAWKRDGHLTPVVLGPKGKQAAVRYPVWVLRDFLDRCGCPLPPTETETAA